MRYLLLLCVLLAAPLRADPEVQSKPCIAGPIIFFRSVQPHVDEVKTQVRAFLGTEVGYGARGDASLFPFATPRYGIRALKMETDALGGWISAQVACEDHIDMRDAEVVDYMTTLFAKLQAERLVLQALQLVDLTRDIQVSPAEKLEGTKQ